MSRSDRFAFLISLMVFEYMESQWSRLWDKLVLTSAVLLDVAVLGSIAFLGPGLSVVLIAGLTAFIYSLFSPVGLPLILVLMSHVGSIYGETIPAAYLAKWGITLVFLAVTLSRWSIEKFHLDYRIGKEETVLFLLLLWGALCSVFAIHPADSFIETVRTSLLLLVYAITKATITEKRQITILLSAVVVVVLMNALTCLSEVNNFGYVRLRGLLGNANYFGMFLMFCLPMVAMGILLHRQRRLRLFFVIGLATGLVLLFLSLSRAALLGCGVQLVTFLLLSKKKKYLGVLAVSGALVVVVIALSPGLRRPVELLLRLQSGTTHRTLLWERGLNAAVENPLLGTGYGVQNDDIPGDITWNDPVNQLLFSARDRRFGPHNAYIYHFMTSGLIGGLLFLSLIYFMLMSQYASWRDAKTSELRNLHAIMIAVLVGCAFHSFFESQNVLAEASVAVYFWISLGIVNATRERQLLDHDEIPQT